MDAAADPHKGLIHHHDVQRFTVSAWSAVTP